MGSLDFGAAAAAIVVVVDDDVVDVLDVLEVELVEVERCVVVVLRCVVVVCGACVVVGASVVVVGAIVVVVGASVVEVVEVVEDVCAPAVPRPKAKVPTKSTSTAAPSAAITARRGANGLITSLTLDGQGRVAGAVSADAGGRNRSCDHLWCAARARRYRWDMCRLGGESPAGHPYAIRLAGPTLAGWSASISAVTQPHQR